MPPAQPDYSGGSMIALYPPPDVARQVAIPGGLDPNSLHVTICYTGDAADVDRKVLRKAAKALASRQTITATIAGHARLPGVEDGLDAIVALVDAPPLDDLRADTFDELASRGVDAMRNHSTLHHLTLAYVGKDDPDPVGRLEPAKVTFTGVTATHGANRKTYAMDDIAPQAAEAFAAGWALSGGPVTEQFQAGAVAAIETAREYAHDPGVLEATLRIGSLRGTWARFFARRQAVIDEHAANVSKVWDTLTTDLAATPVVDRLRAEIGAQQPATPEQRQYLRTITTHAASGLLSGVYAHDQHHHLQNAVQDALRAGYAEGKTGTLAINAEKHGYTITESTGTTFNWDTAYQAIWQQLENLPGLPLTAQQWVQTMLRGSSTSIGILLARLFEAGASRDEMVTALEQALVAAGSQTASERAVILFMDQAIAQAMSQAALDLYASEGITDVYFVDAGDERVCAELCAPAAENSPYTPDSAPLPGLHPLCRCVLTSDDPAPFKALLDLVS